MEVAPILFIIFNRPDTTQKVFEHIRKAKPSKLFLASDGPRPEVQNETKTVEETRLLVDNMIDWECEVFRRYNEENLGCGENVSTAISWMFDHVDSGIILEDDCLPSPFFFEFCTLMLAKYEKDGRVMHVSGSRYNEEYHTDLSYFFSQYAHIWGWATWKRAWDKFDLNLSEFEGEVPENHMQQFFDSKKESKFWTNKLNAGIGKGKKNRWGVQWQYAVSSNSGLAVTPAKNLISNIGPVGAHAKKAHHLHFRPICNEFPLDNSQSLIERHEAFDAYHFNQHFSFKRPLLDRIQRRIKREIKVLLG